MERGLKFVQGEPKRPHNYTWTKRRMLLSERRPLSLGTQERRGSVEDPSSAPGFSWPIVSDICFFLFLHHHSTLFNIYGKVVWGHKFRRKSVYALIHDVQWWVLGVVFPYINNAAFQLKPTSRLSFSLFRYSATTTKKSFMRLSASSWHGGSGRWTHFGRTEHSDVNVPEDVKKSSLPCGCCCWSWMVVIRWWKAKLKACVVSQWRPANVPLNSDFSTQRETNAFSL